MRFSPLLVSLGALALIGGGLAFAARKKGMRFFDDTDYGDDYAPGQRLKAPARRPVGALPGKSFTTAVR